MKIIEAMKQRKDLLRKADDLAEKIRKYHADQDYETPKYGTAERQREQIAEWLQAHSDVLKEYARLSEAIMHTNLETPVTIRIGDKDVTKSIAHWVLRKQGLVERELRPWLWLNDAPGGRKLQEGTITTSAGEKQKVQIRRYYDQKVRDERVDLLQQEPSLIDARLEIVNATTDLLE